MITVRKSYANEIEKYLLARPYKNVLVQNMFDDLGLYSTRPNGKRSYNEGAFPIRQVLYGLPTSKSGKPHEPLQGLEILTDLSTVPGEKGVGTSWRKVLLRYTPPTVVPASSPVSPDASTEEWITPIPGLEWVPPKCGTDFTKVEAQLAAIHLESRRTNALLARLLVAWGDTNPSPSDADLAQWAEDDEQVDKA